jgi:hypothetical protein
LQGAKKTDLESRLKKITQYRNAFAHGTLAHNGESQELHYFEGVPMKSILDDEYFETLEGNFLAAWALLEEIQKAVKRAA